MLPLTPAEVVHRNYAGGGSLSATPGTLRQIASDLETWADKLGCHALLKEDALDRNHSLMEWKDRPPLTLEVSGNEGRFKLEGFRVEGRDVTEHLKKNLWEEAEDYLETVNHDHSAEACEDHKAYLED